ncbi:endolytic transglycosylase MltG [Streptomyces sp. bgisy153]|uniref:endolytic transglycosylase MltG n=1 Tax=Streptomyces sp. bgisy153 TaxID=3413793 RepID=UPI003D7385D3
MTEYGRSPGSEPWPPEDPLFGDGGWDGQQAHTGRQSAYGDRPQHYPQQPQHQEYGDWGTGAQQSAYGQDGRQYDEYGRPYGQQYAPQQHQQQYPGQGQQFEQYDQQYGQQQAPQGGQGQQGRPDYPQGGGWDGTGTHAQVPYAADPGDPYGRQPAAYGSEQPDFYQTPEAYPPPEPPARRRAEPEPEPDWDPGPDQGEHAFFAGGDDDADDTEDDEPPGNRRGRGDRRGGKGAKGGKGTKKRRNGCACLVVLLVFGGGLAGVTYVGYQFYQDRYGAAPDYSGDGTSQSVSVTIPKGAGGAQIGRALKEAGVVKSVDAFVAAFAADPEGKKIQAGAYILHKQMSARSAISMMLDPKSQANVMVTPGQRNIQVYKAIDEKLGLSAGATRKIAEAGYKNLGLPSWANSDEDIKDPLEGFLYPGTYPAAKGMKPEAVLKEMVGRATAAYGKLDLDAKAEQLKLENPLEVITVASLVQAEGKTHDDYRKMAEVIYNRLKPDNTETNRKLQFDSTFNYLRNESNIHISTSEINSNPDPYNTYTHTGLPPGPIGNPGEEALAATMDPTHEGWLYFVATDGMNKTEFAKTLAEAERLRDKFNANTGN